MMQDDDSNPIRNTQSVSPVIEWVAYYLFQQSKYPEPFGETLNEYIERLTASGSVKEERDDVQSTEEEQEAVPPRRG